MVAHVVLQEGGTTIGLQGMRNIAQVIRNRINDMSGHFPYDTAMGIVSQGNGSAFNGWSAPSAREGAYYWPQALDIANSLISGTGTFAHSPGVENCLYFLSCRENEVAEDSSYKYRDAGGGRSQHYFETLFTSRACVAITPTP
jgi:hypothetical protein